MAEYLTNTADLKAVADAIRAKGGMSAPLVYPTGFVSAIQSIDVASGGGTCTVNLTCEASDTNLAYFSPDGVWHMESLPAGDTVFQVVQNSPIFICNSYGYNLTNPVNIVKTNDAVFIGGNGATGALLYTIYYATASTASATQPTD